MQLSFPSRLLTRPPPPSAAVNVLLSCMGWPPAEEARLPQIANEHALAAWGATVAAVRGAAKMWALQEARD